MGIGFFSKVHDGGIHRCCLVRILCESDLDIVTNALAHQTSNGYIVAELSLSDAEETGGTRVDHQFDEDGLGFVFLQVAQRNDDLAIR